MSRHAQARAALLAPLALLALAGPRAALGDDAGVAALAAEIRAEGERLPRLLDFAGKEARLSAACDADDALDRATPPRRGKRTPVVNRVPAYAAVIGEVLDRHAQALADGDLDLAVALHGYLGDGRYVTRHGYDVPWKDREPEWAPLAAVQRAHGLTSDDVNEPGRIMRDKMAAALARETGRVAAALAPFLARVAREGLERGPGAPTDAPRWTFGPGEWLNVGVDFRTDYRDRAMWLEHGVHMLLNHRIYSNQGSNASLAVTLTVDASLASSLNPARQRLVESRGDFVRLEDRYGTHILHFPTRRKTLAYAYEVDPRQDVGGALADALWTFLTSGGPTPPAPPGARRLVLEAEGEAELVPCDPAPAPSPCRLRLKATLVGEDGRPVAGAALAFQAPRMGRWEALAGTTDAAGSIHATYVAPSEDDLAQRGVSVWSEVLRVRDAEGRFEDDVAVTTRSRRGELLVRAQRDVIPSLVDAPNLLTIQARLAPKPGGEEYRVEVQSASGQGLLLVAGAEPGPRVALPLGATSGVEVVYRWKGPQALAAPVTERIVVRVPERGVETAVTFEVGVDLRVVAVRPRDAGELHAYALTALHVEVVDAFRPDRPLDLRRLFDDLRLTVPVRVLAPTYAPPPFDPGASGLQRIRNRFRYDRTDLPPCAPWSIENATVLHPLGAGGGDRWVLAAERPPEGTTAEFAFPGVHLLRRGTYGIAVELGPTPWDAHLGEAPVAAAPLVLAGPESEAVALEETVFLPCIQVLLEILAAELHVGMEAALALRDLGAAFAARDLRQAFTTLWGFAIGRIAGLETLSEVQKALTTLNVFGGYAATAAQNYADATQAPAAKAGARPGLPAADPLAGAQAVVAADGRRSVLLVERAGVSRVAVEGDDGVAWTAAPERLYVSRDPRARLETTPAFVVMPLEHAERARVVLDVGAAGARLALLTPRGTQTLVVPGPARAARVLASAGGELTLEAEGPAAPWVRAAVARARRGARVEVAFRVPAGYDRSAWIGLIPARVPHGRQRPNDDADVVYLALDGRTEGTLTFTIPAAAPPGRYEFRLFPSDQDGFDEVASSAAIQIE